MDRQQKFHRHPARIITLAVTSLFLFLALEANLHLLQPARADPDQITIGAQKDNTLYESATGNTSNGAGSYFFAGATMNGDLRRAVIAFDIAGSIPAGSIINSVSLSLTMSRTVAGAEAITMHRLLQNWGEGTSNADLNEGIGAPATTNDATWIHTFYNTQIWTTAGGSFSATVSASTSVASEGVYTWGTTAQLVSDVQGWLNNPTTNFGWVLVGDEASNQTAKRFNSRQHVTVASRPMLTIDYTPPATSTPTSTNTSPPPTATNTPTGVPPSATPTSTATSQPPTATNTPTNTPTGVPPSATPTATATSQPPTATATPPPGTVTPPPPGEPLDDPIPSPIPPGISIRLMPVVGGLTAPNWGTVPRSCPELRKELFVTDQVGLLYRINLLERTRSVFLDVRSYLVSLGIGGPGTFDERGLLGVAFHPDYAANGLLYTYTSEPTAGPADFSTLPAGTNPNHQSLVREWHVADPCAPDAVADPASSRALLRIDQPQFNHDGGALVFGPDKNLYIALGDGGAGDDQGNGHVPGGNGQEPGNILGTILRIDPTGSDSANGQYGIPTDNPFVGMTGFLPEIYAYGFRNPFRISFDRVTGELYAGDVGQNDLEEIDRVTAGGNYGWNLKEGSFCFDPNGTSPGFVTECAPGQVPPDLIDPIAEYDHDEGSAIIGGFVSRSRSLRHIHGSYIFGDFRRPGGGNRGRLFYLDGLQIYEFQLDGIPELNMAVLGFGEGFNNEIYVFMNSTGTPFGETGGIYRITRSFPKPVLPKPGIPIGARPFAD